MFVCHLGSEHLPCECVCESFVLLELVKSFYTNHIVYRQISGVYQGEHHYY